MIFKIPKTEEDVQKMLTRKFSIALKLKMLEIKNKNFDET